MSIKDIFKASEYKRNMEKLQKEKENLEDLLSPEAQNIVHLQNKLAVLSIDIESAEHTLSGITNNISKQQTELNKIESTINEKKKQIITMDDEILVQEFGLYKPVFDFANSIDFKEELASVRAKQKELIKNKKAVLGNTNWQVNNSASQGKKMIADMQKLLLRAFNSECDDVVSKVKYTNFDSSLSKIHKSAEAISKLGSMMGLRISDAYLTLKVREVRLAFEYKLKKQEEHEAQKQAREELREAAKLQKELEAERKKIDKELSHYNTAYKSLLKQLEQSPDNEELLAKKVEFESKLDSLEASIKDLDYREANQKAGYVYIISNIGSFGENVYKIGMTRRLNPEERISELSDASVPFNFDVHAMIFSDDAPALEASLHRAFEDKKVNLVNPRREFFKVSLDEIKEIIKKNYDKTVEFFDVADAEQYRISEKMRAKS